MPFDVYAAIAARVRAEAFRQSGNQSAEPVASGASVAGVPPESAPEAGAAVAKPPGAAAVEGPPHRVPAQRGAADGRRGLRAVLAAVLRGR